MKIRFSALVLTVAASALGLSSSAALVPPTAAVPMQPTAVGNPYCGATPPTPQLPVCPGLEFSCVNPLMNDYEQAWSSATAFACDKYDLAIELHAEAAAEIQADLDACVAAAEAEGQDTGPCYAEADELFHAIDQLLQEVTSLIQSQWLRRTEAAKDTYDAAVEACCNP